MDPELLRAFLTVADTGSFRRAATRLHIAPSTLSGHITKLERQCGHPLFHRHPVCLTSEGERLLPAAQDAVRATDAAAQRARDIRNAPGIQLRIGVLSHGAGPLMAAHIAAYQQQHPHVSIRLVALAFSEIPSALLADRVDVAFIRPQLNDPRFDEYPLLQEQRHAILPTTDERAHLPSLTVADLDRDTFLTPATHSPASYNAFLHLLNDRNNETPRLTGSHCDHAEEFLAAVAAGLGIATTITSFTHHYRWPNISYVPIHDTTPAATTAIVRSTDNRRAVRDFTDRLAA